MFLIYMIVMLIIFGFQSKNMTFEMEQIWLLVTFSVTAIVYALETRGGSDGR